MIIKNMKIIPAILELEKENIKNKINYLSTLKEKYVLDFNLIQIDFCDGDFVENKNWLPQNTAELKEIVDLEKNFNIEAHLMCKDTKKYFDICKDAGIKNIIIHVDNFLDSDRETFLSILTESADTKINLGLCSKLPLMRERGEEILSLFGSNRSQFTESDFYLQVMGIENIGRQGEPFAKESISVIQAARDLFPEEELKISVDGAVNENTFSIYKQAGASSIVVGSYFLKAEDENQLIERYNKLKS